jgi:hypothetical protein
MLPQSSGFKNKPNKKKAGGNHQVAVLAASFLLVTCLVYSLTLK